MADTKSLFEAHGNITAIRKDGRAFQLDSEKWYSLFGGVKNLYKGDYVRFKYSINGDFNNIEEKTIELLEAPKDISKNYSQESFQKSTFSPDKDTLIVRQSCLKAAVECIMKGIELAKPKEEVNMLNLILKQAEEFEKWVFRE